MASATSPPNARFSTYSGAPSLKPSLAPTFDSTDTRHSYTTTTPLSPHNKRYSTASMYRSGPAALDSALTLSPNDPRAVDITTWSGALERMLDSRLEQQRFVMNDNKTDEVSKLALSAKVERALDRRMSGQDAVFLPKKRAFDAEKRALELKAR